MALKMRKDIKKSSYYVWFLGAKESKGLRGKEFIQPVIEHLVQREKDIEPFKVTLQVSHKGLKIIQTVLTTNPKTAKPKNETIKHFIPHNTITCVYQDEDIVSCILLLFNPVTKCPLHVHVYRCDSVETASLLKGQLETLIERPENQKKFSDLENRVKPPKEKKKFDSSLGSDTGTSTRESESSEERYSSGENRITTLYDSLAAELRQKLGKNETPILLPPRDYDTVHRQKGNLQNIDLRRCLNTNIVGQSAKGRRIESSGGSSGIGSDHAPSPDSPDSPERYNMLDNQSTSDEEWNAEPNDSTLYLMHGASDMILPRASRHGDPSKFSPEPPKSPDYRPDARFNRYPDQEAKYHEKALKETSKYQEPAKRYERYDTMGSEKEISYMENPKYHQRYHEESQKYPAKYEVDSRRVADSTRHVENGYKSENKHRAQRYVDDFDEEVDYRDKRSNKDEIPRPRTKYNPEDPRFYTDDSKPERSRSKYDDFYQAQEPKPRYYEPETRDMSRSKYPADDQRYYGEYDENKPRSNHEYYDPQKPKYNQEERHYYQESKTLEKPTKMKFNPEDPRFYSESRHSEKSSRSKYSQEEAPRLKYTPEDFFDDVSESRRRPEDRQRSPTPPEINVSPRDRFKDAKEKFLLLERDRLEEQERLRRQDMVASSPNLNNMKDKTFLKRHESMVHPKDRYLEDRRYEMDGRYQPKPAPRTIVEEDVRYRRDVPLDRYRSPDRYEQNRRSMFSQIEEEHKKNSNEIAKELKRRSYMENNFEKDYYREKSYGEVADPKRYPGLDREGYPFSKSNVELDKVGEKYDVKYDAKFDQKYDPKYEPKYEPKYDQKYEPKYDQKYDPKYDPKYAKTQKQLKQPAGYRHSYAEPKLSLEKLGKKHFPEMVHRTNSSVSNSGRVGIASVNPY